jgi:diguanylate cyclase
VKIDRSFMRNIDQSHEDQALVRAIVVASKALQLDVTSEGIETAEQLVLAGKLGCDRAQGFYFSKPVPAMELEPWFSSACPVGNPA